MSSGRGKTLRCEKDDGCLTKNTKKSQIRKVFSEVRGGRSIFEKTRREQREKTRRTADHEKVILSRAGVKGGRGKTLSSPVFRKTSRLRKRELLRKGKEKDLRKETGGPIGRS